MACVRRELNALHQKHGFSIVIDGGQTGADTLAHEWAQEQGIDPVRCPALWSALGRAAGRRRNAFMLSFAKPEMVVAFPGGKGTRLMLDLAKAVHIPTVEIRA
jgi:predicted Rossmann-fold nucleotide-binding protein